MLRIYHLDFFISYCLSTKISLSLNQKGWQFSCHLITCRNVKDLSPENVYLVLFRVGVIKIVIVINCNLITFSKVIACNCN